MSERRDCQKAEIIALSFAPADLAGKRKLSPLLVEQDTLDSGSELGELWMRYPRAGKYPWSTLISSSVCNSMDLRGFEPLTS
jgi:hypothetical protein